MAGRVRINSPEARRILLSLEVRDELRRVAEPIRDRCQASAPVDTGTFAASFQVQDATTDRAVARVVTVDPDGLVKEARFRTMTRALQ